ncbi:MAG: 30S ribosomal protein S2 [Deltaproteobacteria bacterium RIFCSPLOWO2_12_FULL_40_28]|nr:MAG: 30S ribosomal protein S2 [Deltaproteobacteria bacterium RIFCSPHIGHO2_02_FULL_40_28]OGQ18964.1 MAG: 30S ribosomal protein S2 [Deltaproteobacteria bacterium RIFCSPHIGHO2_12_FULL_40_32]OGQ39507.1 MAG: 30S ribosomal protein S2 [Deltaproteobacteria bacterium RIFCSPLOWO2_02_FULL_40_36]OGQ53397.1 MAG: 30S ribosomal protein S2 [Deltaproteobacteria bacterium RIFCSPLOWO2_12_FULL_40_28]
MVEISIQEMIEAGAHFGHQTRKWNPKMKPYLYGTRSGVHIIDLGQTFDLAKKAFNLLEEVVASGKHVLFVGTKEQAQTVIEDAATKSSMPYVTRRWMGGMLTNFSTIRRSVERMIDLETRRTNNDFAGFTKKELLGVDRAIEKLNAALGGIRNMNTIPGALFVVDPSLEDIAVHEANVLNVPVIAITDSNCNPDPIDYVIPANDDALRSIQIFTERALEACLRGLEKREALARGASDEKKKKAQRVSQPAEAGRAYVKRAESFEANENEKLDSFSAQVEVEEVQETIVEEIQGPKE